VERTNSRTPFFSGGTDSTSRQRGAAGSARGWPGRTHGSPRRPQRQRHGRGRAAPRKLLVRRGERSLRSGRCFRRKPQRLTSLSTPTFPPPGHKERGRPTGRARGLIRGSQRPGVITIAEGGAARPLLVRRAGPSLRDASCFHRTPQHPTSLSTPTFPPPASSEHARPTGRACGLIRGSQRPGGVRPSKGNNAAPGVFQARNHLFFFRAGRFPVFSGGGIHPPDGDTSPGFPSGGAGFFPIHPGQVGKFAGTISTAAASVSSIPAGRRGSDHLRARRRPSIRWTTTQRRGFHPAARSASFPSPPGRNWKNRGNDPGRRLPSFPSRRDDAARIVAVRRINPGRGGDRPIRRTTTQRRGSVRRRGPLLSHPGRTTRPGSSPSAGSIPDAATSVRTGTTPRLRRPGRRARPASFLRRHLAERSTVVATTTTRRLSLSSSVCLSVSVLECL